MLPVVRGCYPAQRDNTMMAVDVLTQKMRDQSLEEVKNQNKSQIKLIRPGKGLKLSKNAEATIAGTGKKVYALQLKSNSGVETKQELKSKSEEFTSSTSNTAIQYAHSPFRRFPNIRNKACDNGGISPVDPPKKRHCRSLSVPVDGPTPTDWQPQQSHVWKPITVVSESSAMFTPNFNIVNSATNSRTYNTQGAGFVSIDGSVGENIEGCGVPSDIFTPPESPVPRPSSASTFPVRHDAMFSPLNVPWLEPFSFHQKYHAFDHRSLSCEDQISCSSSSSSTASVPAYVSSHHSSPHRHRIPRCRSQPSVLHDRKYGVKRRRDYDRPALNFHKMKETAYQRRPASHPMSTPRLLESRRTRFHDELECAMNLMPIASSPLDNDIPITLAMESRTSPISEMEQASSDSTEFLDGDPADFIHDGPVKLIGEIEHSETDEVEEVFQLQEDLDLEQIETN